MKKFIFFISVLLFSCTAFSQPVEVQIFQKEAVGSTVKIGFKARATGADVTYIGVSFLMFYQSTGIAPLSTAQNSGGGVDDSRLTTTFGWGIGARNTNPVFVVNDRNPSGPGQPIYDRAYIYGNGDETLGTKSQVLTSTWDTLMYITFNTLQPTYPEGGYAYHPSTAQQATVGIIDLFLATLPFSVTTSDIPLGKSIVPVLFSQFDAKCNADGTTLLSWSTAQETNSEYFEIEKSNDGSHWQTLSRVPAAGNSSITKNYQRLDNEGGMAFYRIKQVDFNGTSFYTDVKATQCISKSFSNIIYPVPTKDVLFVSIKSDKILKTKLQVFDASGKMVKTLEAPINVGNNIFNINVKGLPAGQYLLKSIDKEVNITKPFVVIH